MKLLTEHKKYYKPILLVIIFSLLIISILQGVIKTNAVSSTEVKICVPIMMYHQVKDKKLGKDVISPYEFESDLIYLKEHNYNTITMTDLIHYVYYDKELPENPIILTFDDGYLNTYVNVFPLLKQYNMKIVLSIVGKSVDNYSKVCDNHIDYACITWDEVREMVDSGLVEIQNHSYDLHKIKNGRYGCYHKDGESFSQYEQVLMEDVSALQDKVKQITNSIPNTFTYPYGKYNNDTETILKQLGFKATLSCRYGVNLINKDPEKLYGLKRICRAHNENVGVLISEAMKTLKYIKE